MIPIAAHSGATAQVTGTITDRDDGVPTPLRSVVRARDRCGSGCCRRAKDVIEQAIRGVAEGDAAAKRARAGVVRGARVDDLELVQDVLRAAL